MEVKNVITKETLMPVGLVISILGGVFWFSSVYSTVNQSADRIERLEAKMDVVYERTARMEATLDALISKDFTLK